jgi:hypothetical protein
LDAPTNSALNNSQFDVKREIIRKREIKENVYIPICTRNAFLKAYTADAENNAYWTEADRTAYFGNIKNMYNYFLRIKSA